MTNEVLSNREELKTRHYIRKADPDARYWFDFSMNRLDSYRDRFKNDFCLIVAGSDTVAGDYYKVPYVVIAHMLTESSLVDDAAGRKRWIGHIQQHRLRITHYPQELDIGQFYGLPLSESSELPESIENDYAIENRRVEIKQRVKQSLFRKRVLSNFSGRCCITGIDEPSLLVASHIVPWAVGINSRLDPGNGLCLFVLYDALFDLGYFTLTDELRVTASSYIISCDELSQLLRKIDGQLIRPPSDVPIKSEYLDFHRTNIFRA